MDMNREKIVSGFVIIVAIVAVGYYIFNDIKHSAVIPNDIVEDNKGTTTGNMGIEGSGDYKIELISSETIKSPIGLSVPDLDRPVVFTGIFSDGEKMAMIKDIKRLSEELKEDSNLFNNWLSLGLQRKEIGDYEGAREAWEYASVISPTNSVSLSNLGDLYHYYLKDYVKSEENLLKAIENSSGNIALYRSLHELYKYSYKEKAGLADDILFKGLEENPNNLDLLILLGLYYKETEDIENSRKYYGKALVEAQKQGNNDLVDALQQNIQELPSL